MSIVPQQTFCSAVSLLLLLPMRFWLMSLSCLCKSVCRPSFSACSCCRSREIVVILLSIVSSCFFRSMASFWAVLRRYSKCSCDICRRDISPFFSSAILSLSGSSDILSSVRPVSCWSPLSAHWGWKYWLINYLCCYDSRLFAHTNILVQGPCYRYKMCTELSIPDVQVQYSASYRHFEFAIHCYNIAFGISIHPQYS